jgi:hypothetical protein
MSMTAKTPAGMIGGRVSGAILVVAFVSACVGCAAAALIFCPHYFLDGLPTDTDSMTRIAFLDWATANGGLNHHLFMRDGGSHGLQLHWTAPFDVILLAASAPFAALHGWHDGIREGVRFVMPSLQIAFGCAAVSWLCLSLNARRALPWALALVPFCGPFTILAVTIPAKYQMTSAAIATVALASSFRLARFGTPRQAAWTVAWLVLTAWMSIETLPEVMAVSCVVLVGAACRTNARRAYRSFSAILVPAALLPMVLDWGPEGFFSLAADRYSLLHVMMFWLLSAGVVYAPAVVDRGDRRRPLIILCLAAAACGIAFLAWRHVPAVYSNKLIWLYFLDSNLDMQSSWLPAFRNDMIMPTLAVVVALVATLRRAGRPQARWRLLAVGILLGETALAWKFHRLAGYPAVLSVAVLGAALASVAGALGSRSGLAALPTAALAAVAVFLVTRVGHGPFGPPVRQPCEMGDGVARAVRAAVPEENAIVLADIWSMPELLARVPGVRTVAGPYHRAVDAMSQTALAFIYPDEKVLRDVMAKWGATYVMACVAPERLQSGYFYGRSFLVLMATGDVGPSFVAVPTGSPYIKLYRLAASGPRP